VEYLESVAAVARASMATPVVTSVVTGAAAAALCEYVESHSVGLVVMTTHGRGGLSRWWLGSVADRMLRRLDVPVLLLQPGDVAQPTEFRRILVALDGETEEPVVEAAFALAGQAPPARYVFTRVVEPTIPVLSGFAARPGHLPPNWNEVREIEARNYLARLTDRLRAKGLNATSQVLIGRGIAGQVLDLADAIGADCIVAGTHGARGMERLMLGSVADKIVRGAKVPVLVAPVRQR
jgi:nucleotide-binding universal stress UspA family protein